DESCRTILRNCRASATPGARAVVIETVLGEIGKPDLGPLMDMNMLSCTEGQEREVDELDALYAASGWRRVATHKARASHVIMELDAI
ncbi:MAG: hypothetical protein FWD17_11605, partial [Polyangiaceae bacterium]|nr:hypothetical protein [Polyangiaceae bacterium]